MNASSAMHPAALVAASIDMQRVYGARDLAGMKIPGAPTTQRGIKKMALREGWRFVKQSGRGGGDGYPVTALPQAWQAFILRPAIEAARAQDAETQPQTVKIANLRKNASSALCLARVKEGQSEPAISAGRIMQDITARQRAARAAARDMAPAPSPRPSPTGGEGEERKAGLTSALSHGGRGGKEVELPAFRVMTAAEQARADARIAVLGAFEAWQGQSELSISAGLKAFCALYNDGGVALEGWVLQHVPALSVNSLRNWARKSKQQGVAALAGKYDHRRGTGAIDSTPALLEFCAAQILHKPHLSATRLADAIEAAHSVTIPVRSVQRWMRNWRKVNAGIVLHVSNPDAHRSHRGAGFGSRSEGIMRLNQLWEIDATPADVMLKDGRHSVVGVIDVYTRRAMCLVTKTPKAVANTALLRRAILEWGLPESIKTDNGSDFTAKHMVRALRDLNIRHELCPPFTPQAKPHIERFFNTLTTRLFEILPGFIGHNVAQRQAIENRRAFADRLGESGGKFDVAELTADELQNYINIYLENDHHHNIAAPGSQETPFERWTRSRDSVKRISDERALDILLAEAPDGDGFRVVGKKGVSVRNYFHIAPELAAMVGERVHVRLDATDAGRIFCYALDGAFICVAECPEMTGISRREVAMMAQAAAKDAHKQGRKYVRELIRAHRPDEMAQQVLAHKVRKHAHLIGFPKKAVETTTQALLSAGEAAEALDNSGRPPAPTPISAEDRALAAEAAAGMAQARSNIVALHAAQPGARPEFRDDFEFAHWALANIATLDAADMDFLDEILLGRGMNLVFGAAEITAARARQARRHLTA